MLRVAEFPRGAPLTFPGKSAISPAMTAETRCGAICIIGIITG
jgi:hypothetical protein